MVAVRRLRVAHAQKKKKHAGSTLARKKEMERGRAGGRVRLAVVLMYHQIRGVQYEGGLLGLGRATSLPPPRGRCFLGALFWVGWLVGGSLGS